MHGNDESTVSTHRLTALLDHVLMQPTWSSSAAIHAVSTPAASNDGRTLHAGQQKLHAFMRAMFAAEGGTIQAACRACQA